MLGLQLSRNAFHLFHAYPSCYQSGKNQFGDINLWIKNPSFKHLLYEFYMNPENEVLYLRHGVLTLLRFLDCANLEGRRFLDGETLTDSF